MCACRARQERRGGRCCRYGPVIDGVNLLGEPWKLFQQHKHNTKVPVILGSNRDEMALFLILEAPLGKSEVVQKAEFKAAAKNAAPGKEAEVEKLYSFNGTYPYPDDLGNYNKWWWMTMRVATDTLDSLGHCSVRTTARALAAAGNPGVWAYLFAHPSALPNPLNPDAPAMTALVPHASEIPFAMNCESMKYTDCKFKKADSALLADSMYDYWYNFAKSSDPNSDRLGKVKWPQYTADGDETLRFDTPQDTDRGTAGVAVQTGVRKEACDFWDAQG